MTQNVRTVKFSSGFPFTATDDKIQELKDNGVAITEPEE